MKKTTVLSIIISFLFLLIGIFIYFIASQTKTTLIIFLRNYGADFCWLISFVFALYPFIRNIFKKSVLITGSFCFVFGVIFEFLQKFNLTKGTGDICDILSYLLATILSCLLIKYIYKREKNYEKTY